MKPGGDPGRAPAVSVVIPLFNKRSTVERTIDSVLRQTFADFEILVIDDGSTDGGAELVERRYAEERRLSLHRYENAGPGAARNRGLALGRGRLVTFLDADDAWRPELLERAVAALAKHADCAAFTASFVMEPSGVDRWAALRREGFSEGPWRLTPRTPKRRLRRCLDAFHQSTTVYRREAVAALGGFYTDERCTFGEDVFLWIQVLLNHAIYRHTAPLAHYHMEDSELGIGARRGPLPLEPVLTRPERIRASCPPQLLPQLELWLAWQAIRASFMQLARGDPACVGPLLARFPAVRKWRTGYLKLQLKRRIGEIRKAAAS